MRLNHHKRSHFGKLSDEYLHHIGRVTSHELTHVPSLTLSINLKTDPAITLVVTLPVTYHNQGWSRLANFMLSPFCGVIGWHLPVQATHDGSWYYILHVMTCQRQLGLRPALHMGQQGCSLRSAELKNQRSIHSTWKRCLQCSTRRTSLSS